MISTEENFRPEQKAVLGHFSCSSIDGIVMGRAQLHLLQNLTCELAHQFNCIAINLPSVI